MCCSSCAGVSTTSRPFLSTASCVVVSKVEPNEVGLGVGVRGAMALQEGECSRWAGQLECVGEGDGEHSSTREREDRLRDEEEWN